MAVRDVCDALDVVHVAIARDELALAQVEVQPTCKNGKVQVSFIILKSFKSFCFHKRVLLVTAEKLVFFESPNVLSNR